jgi:hypothetical protein
VRRSRHNIAKHEDRGLEKGKCDWDSGLRQHSQARVVSRSSPSWDWIGWTLFEEYSDFYQLFSGLYRAFQAICKRPKNKVFIQSRMAVASVLTILRYLRARDLLAFSLIPSIDTCRICSAPAEPDQPLFHPCKCSGTIRYIHQDWLASLPFLDAGLTIVSV